MSRHNLAHHGDWHSCQFDVLNTALVLDFVFSDSAKRSWDNNAQQVSISAAVLCCCGTEQVLPNFLQVVDVMSCVVCLRSMLMLST